MYLSSLFSSALRSSAFINFAELISFTLRLRTTSITISAVIITVTRTATVETTVVTTISVVPKPSRKENYKIYIII